MPSLFQPRTTAVLLSQLNGQTLLQAARRNPRGIQALHPMQNGLDVVERVPLEIPPGATNLQYLRTKQSKLGHLFTNLDAKTVKS